VINKSVELGKATDADAASIRPRLRTTTSVADAVRGADVVIEAAPEKIDLKLALFKEVEAAAPAHAVFASNTSALSHHRDGRGARQSRPPGRDAFLQSRAPHEARRNRQALDTTPATIAVMEEVSAKMGKETVLVKESPGFVTSRINAMIGNEAFYMLQEGVASARDIDKALKLGLNHPMGPFELVDLVGLDTRLSILQYLHRTLGDKFKPVPLLEQHVGRAARTQVRAKASTTTE
jgi:3-hydroxybutyryl-CoA dehydrogenase